MGRTVAWDDIPDSSIVPENVYHVRITELSEQHSKSMKLMYNCRFEVIEPQDFTGFPVNDNYVIGSDDDPNADDTKTWRASIGARRMKKILKDAGVPFEGDMDMVCAAAENAELLIKVVQEVDDGTRDPKYKGNVRNRIAASWPVGGTEVGGTTTQAVAAPAPKPAAPRPAAAAPAAPKAAPVAAVAPKAAPVAAAPKAAPKAVAAAPKAAPAPAAEAPSGGALFPCAICRAEGKPKEEYMFSEAEFGEHVAAH